MPDDEAAQFAAFARELGELSAKYGVVVQAVGGVHVLRGPASQVVYSDDMASGDLMPVSITEAGETLPWDRY